MNEQNYPRLEHMHVLRTAALSSIRDRAFEALPLACVGFGDGIVSGCTLTTNSDSITLQPGLIIFHGFMYYVKEPMSVEYEPTDEYRVLKIRFFMPEETENFIRRDMELFLTERIDLQQNEMELCRFKLKSGAVLRTKYVDFFDRLTEFDTANNISCLHAVEGGNTLSPQITKAFAEEAMECSIKSSLDQFFCLEALSGRALTRAQISFYLTRRLKQKVEADSNTALFEGLCQVLRMIKEGGEMEFSGSKRARREVLID